MATLRNSKDIIKGSHLMVFMEDANGDLQPIAFATSHTFSKQLNTQEVNCKDFGDVSAVLPQNYSWTMQTDNLYSINGYQAVNNAFKDMAKVLVYFGETNYRQTSTQASIVDVDVASDWSKEGFGEQGYAYITALDVTASAGENATFSATFTGTGTLEEVETLISYDITLLASSTLASNLTLSANESLPEQTITLTPLTSSYSAGYVDATTSPATNIAWNIGSSRWEFTMPSSDVTVTATSRTLYEITKSGETTLYNVTPNSYMPERQYQYDSYIHLVPTDSSYVPSNGYIMTAYTTSGHQSIELTFDNVNTYWQFPMPGADVTTFFTHE